jgi:hypothetical protein
MGRETIEKSAVSIKPVGTKTSRPIQATDNPWRGNFHHARSKAPGAVVTDPPTAKLPCSRIISGPGLFFPASCALAELMKAAAISQSTMKDFRYFLLIGFALVTLRSENCRLLFPASYFCMISPAICPS